MSNNFLKHPQIIKVNSVTKPATDLDGKKNAWYTRLKTCDISGIDIDNRWMIQAFTMLALQDQRTFTTTQFEGMVAGGNSKIREILHNLLGSRGGFIGAQYIPFAKDSNYRNWQYFWDDGVVTVSHSDDDTSVTIFAMDEKERDEIVVALQPHTGKKRSAGKAFVMAQSPNGIQMRAVSSSAQVPFEPGNYAEEVAHKFKYMVDQFASNTPNGRIMIFRGPAGTGKTHLIRALVGAVERATFVVVPSAMIGDLDGPNLIGTLINTYSNADGPIALILEDADSVLASRQGDNMHSISSLLNLSDGILGNLMDLRIIATTNALKEELDEAVVRDGRLCVDLEVGPLSLEHANKVYQRLTKDPNATLPPPKDGDGYKLATVYKLSRPDTDPTITSNNNTKSPIGFTGGSFGEEDAPALVPDDIANLGPTLTYDEVASEFGTELANDIANEMKVVRTDLDGNIAFVPIEGAPKNVSVSSEFIEDGSIADNMKGTKLKPTTEFDKSIDELLEELDSDIDF